MADGTHIRTGQNQRSYRIVCIVLVAALVAVIAVFCYLAFAHQTHDGHGQADPTKQSLLLVRGPAAG